MWLHVCYMHLFEWKTHQDRRWSAYLHFLETLPSWSLSERQIMVAAPTSHMIRFGPLSFRPVKGKKTNKCTVALVLNDWNETSVLHSNFEMETSHVVTHMIFHAITADQNARIRVLHRCDSDMCIPVICVSPWYVYPRDMCIPAHISLVICVSPVGIHKTLIRAWAFNEQNGDSVARFRRAL